MLLVNSEIWQTLSIDAFETKKPAQAGFLVGQVWLIDGIVEAAGRLDIAFHTGQLAVVIELQNHGFL